MKSTLLAAMVAVTLGSAVGTGALAQDAPSTDKDKLSYGLGMMIGDRVLQNYGDIDYDQLMKGMMAQHKGEETALTMQEAQDALQAQQQAQAAAAAATAQKAGQDYLASNKAREGVMVTDSGLQYEVLSDADGAKPGLDDTVSVHYVGTLIDGTEFDSSIARGEPASFPLKGVIPGWTEGLQLMPLGSKYRFVIPSELAYGERGAGQSIGPGETLVFEVELLEIK